MTQHSAAPEMLELHEIAEIFGADLDLKMTEDAHGAFAQRSSAGQPEVAYLQGLILESENEAKIVITPAGELDTRDPNMTMVVHIETPSNKKLTSVSLDVTRGICREDVQMRSRIVKNLFISRS